MIACLYAFLMILILTIRLNPEDSFLALRIFKFIAPQANIPCSQFENFLENVAEFISMSPQEVERDELGKILETWFDYIRGGVYITNSSRLLSKPHL